MPGQTQQLNLLLDKDYSVKVLNQNGQPTGQSGSWSVVYDQAIVVELPRGKFMANMRYNLKPNVQASQYDSLNTGSYNQFDSVCDETMVGVAFGSEKQVQCWVGYQTQPLTTQQAQDNGKVAELILAQTDAEVNAEADAAAEMRSNNVPTHLMGNNFAQIPAADRIRLA